MPEGFLQVRLVKEAVSSEAALWGKGRRLGTAGKPRLSDACLALAGSTGQMGK